MVMLPLTFATLLGTPAPTAVYVGIVSIALFAIVGVVVGPDYDNMNITAKDNITKPKG